MYLAQSSIQNSNCRSLSCIAGTLEEASIQNVRGFIRCYTVASLTSSGSCISSVAYLQANKRQFCSLVSDCYLQMFLFNSKLYMCIYIYIYIYIYIHTHTHTYIYTYTYICIYVCMYFLCCSIVICVALLLFALFCCYLCCSVVICVVLLLFVFLYVLSVCNCVLPPGDNPTAVHKYIIYHFVLYHIIYHIIPYHII